ncbi:MAG: ferritin-like domain-containing protein [Pseudomonadota bacterium]
MRGMTGVGVCFGRPSEDGISSLGSQPTSVPRGTAAPGTTVKLARQIANATASVLETSNARDKALAGKTAFDFVKAADKLSLGAAAKLMSARGADPARPPKPDLAPPREMKRRRLSSPAGRIALLHAVAHIEFNAINLAFDMATRFAREIDDLGLDAAAFVSDWVRIGADEARHYLLIDDLLAQRGAGYGDLPAHDGLWQAARETSDFVDARLAIAPMVLEARGLDVTPGMISNLSDVGDTAGADALGVIYREEIDHVLTGRHWFEMVCEAKRVDPVSHFRALVASRFSGGLKPPFNHEARELAGFSAAYYSEEIGRADG